MDRPAAAVPGPASASSLTANDGCSGWEGAGGDGKKGEFSCSQTCTVKLPIVGL